MSLERKQEKEDSVIEHRNWLQEEIISFFAKVLNEPRLSQNSTQNIIYKIVDANIPNMQNLRTIRELCKEFTFIPEIRQNCENIPYLVRLLINELRNPRQMEITPDITSLPPQIIKELATFIKPFDLKSFANVNSTTRKLTDKLLVKRIIETYEYQFTRHTIMFYTDPDWPDVNNIVRNMLYLLENRMDETGIPLNLQHIYKLTYKYIRYIYKCGMYGLMFELLVIDDGMLHQYDNVNKNMLDLITKSIINNNPDVNYPDKDTWSGVVLPDVFYTAPTQNDIQLVESFINRWCDYMDDINGIISFEVDNIPPIIHRSIPTGIVKDIRYALTRNSRLDSENQGFMMDLILEIIPFACAVERNETLKSYFINTLDSYFDYGIEIAFIQDVHDNNHHREEVLEYVEHALMFAILHALCTDKYIEPFYKYYMVRPSIITGIYMIHIWEKICRQLYTKYRMTYRNNPLINTELSRMSNQSNVTILTEDGNVIVIDENIKITSICTYANTINSIFVSVNGSREYIDIRDIIGLCCSILVFERPVRLHCIHEDRKLYTINIPRTNIFGFSTRQYKTIENEEEPDEDIDEDAIDMFGEQVFENDEDRNRVLRIQIRAINRDFQNMDDPYDIII